MAKISAKDKIYYILLGIIAILGIVSIYVTFNYWDGQTLMAWSISNWDLLFEGRMGDFYIEKVTNVRGAIQAGSEASLSPFMLIPTMIWCLPIWLTHYFNGSLNVGTVGCVYWYKLFLLVMTALIALVVYQIVLKISENKTNALIGVLVVMASPEVLLSTGYCGQDEVVYLFGLLMALKCMLNNRKKAFVAWSVGTVTLCPITIFFILPMIVIKEKNWLKIIGKTLLMFLPMLLWSLVAINLEKPGAIDSAGDHIANIFDYFSIPVTNGSASLMIALFVVFVAYLYWQKDIDDVRTIWMSTLPVVWLSFFSNDLFYRSLLFIPFLAILIGVHKEGSISLKLFLLAVLEYIRFFTLGIDSTQTMNTRYVVKSDWLINLCNNFGSEKYNAYDSLVSKIIEKIPTLHSLGGILNGVGLAIIALLLWITYSENNEKHTESEYYPCLKLSAMIYAACMMVYMVVFYGLLLK